MKTIKQKIEHLIDKKDMQHHNVGMFYGDFDFYETAKVLISNGIYPAALVSPFDNNCTVMGLPVLSVRNFTKQYKNTIILLSRKDYIAFHALLNEYGYSINHNLYVDIEIKSWRFISSLTILETKAKVMDIPNKLNWKYHSIKKYLRCLYDQGYGFVVYRSIRRQYPNIPIYVYDYTGMGDVYVFCLFLNANMNLIAPGGMVISVIGNVSKRVTDMFQIKHVVKLTAKESACLTHLSRLMGEKLNIYPMTPFPARLHTEIFSRYIYGNQLNMAEAYQYVMFNLPKHNIKYPDFPKGNNIIQKLFYENELEKGKTIIISPYANTIIGYPPYFWAEVISRFKKIGFSICTNCSGREPALSGTVRLTFPLEIAEEVIDYAGFFLGLRSGFCDIICNSSAFKYIIYPDYAIFNSNVYTFCSFDRMKIGRNFKEICWDYSDLELLADTISQAMKHALFYRTIQKNE